MILNQEQLNALAAKVCQLVENGPYILLTFDQAEQKVQVVSNIKPGPGLQIMQTAMENWPKE